MSRREAFMAATALILAPVLKMFESVVLPVSYRPDFLVVLAVSSGWSCDVWVAAPSGFAIGLVEDLLTGRAPGMRSISLAVAALAASLVKRVVSPDSLVSKVLAALASAGVADVASFAILRATGVRVDLVYFLRSILPVTVVWAGLLMLPVDFILTRVSQAFARLWPARRRDREAAA